MRKAIITRKTGETDIKLILSLDRPLTGRAAEIIVNTGVGFLDHMLTLFAAHGHFGLTAECSGDLEVDAHHTVEDMGIALGQAFNNALGERRGITRYGSALLPMDEALAMVAADISGRAHLTYEVNAGSETVGAMDAGLIEEFFLGFTRAAGITLHIRQFSGKNAHHIIEAVFKGFGRAMAQAAAPDERLTGGIPSTKGVL